MLGALLQGKAVVGVGEDKVATGELILDFPKPSPPPVITISSGGDIDRLIGKDGIPQNAGFLHLLDRPLSTIDQLFKRIEQQAIKMPPLLVLLEIVNVTAITLFGRAWVGAMVPRDT